DIKIINNKAHYQTLCEKKNNALANLALQKSIDAASSLQQGAPPPYYIGRSNVSRRLSEPPRPLMAPGGMHHNNHSCHDLACTICEPSSGVESGLEPSGSEAATDSDADTRESSQSGRVGSAKWGEVLDDKDSSKTISRANLRRDSFGEVVSSRRSPSQDSIPFHEGQDLYLGRSVGSQDSLEYQASGQMRILSQESLGTMSSRGSIYSVTSGRSEVGVSRCSSKETVRNHAPLLQPLHGHPAYMNG
ncbi:unnamed protein product, partial [Meganyctiphanes norvegica]